jgi:pimeloyl-ACP methyl ester carboxylesterase
MRLQYCQRPGGRLLGFEEFGNFGGKPVFYFHGWPASRLEARLLDNIRVRLIAIDRPGYGKSHPSAGRTLLDWAEDVRAVADLLEISSFHIAGLSGGGPYALSCAFAMPERVKSIALVCSVPPLKEMDRLSVDLTLLRWLGQNQALASPLFSAARNLLLRRVFPMDLIARLSLPVADKACFTRDVARGLAEAWREGLKDSVAGALSDAHLYCKDWGFSINAIKVPAVIWQGSDDKIVPAASVAAFTGMPHKTLHLMDQEGHYSLPLRHGPKILETLIATE